MLIYMKRKKKGAACDDMEAGTKDKKNLFRFSKSFFIPLSPGRNGNLLPIRNMQK